MRRHQTAFAIVALSISILACLPLSQGTDLTATPLPTASPTPPPTPTLAGPTPTPVVLPTATAQLPVSPPVATPTVTPTPVSTDTGWRPVARGIEVRRLDVETDAALVEQIVVARLDPTAVRFRVVYAPGEPRLISAWAQQTGAALLVVNGGYFTPEYHATGLTVSGGQTYGRSYGAYAGIFAVPEGGRPSVRWLTADPLDPREPLREAVECFPVLVKPGGAMGFPADADEGNAARRTVVAQDRLGNILFVIASRGHLSLHALAVWLVASDLEVDTALNLDGGPSSGLWLAGTVQLDSYVPVPAVIAVFSADGSE